LPEPWYVLEIEADRNRIVLGPKEYLYKNQCTATGMNWVSIPAPELKIKAEAKIRLQHNAAECIVIPIDDKNIEVIFDEPQLSITPGQGLVLYSDDLLLGGGFIE